MAFLHTLSFFLATATQHADNKFKVLPKLDAERAAGAFAKCAAGTAWGKEYMRKNGAHSLNSVDCSQWDAVVSNCEQLGSAAKCCPVACRYEHVCAGEKFEDTGATPAASPYTETTQCLESTFAGQGQQLTTWQHVDYNSCAKLRKGGYMDYDGVQLCCPEKERGQGEKLRASYECPNDDAATAWQRKVVRQRKGINNRECVFPFTYKETEYNECAKTEPPRTKDSSATKTESPSLRQGKSWCFTNAELDEWQYCLGIDWSHESGYGGAEAKFSSSNSSWSTTPICSTVVFMILSNVF